jgi:hypothetical protein
MLRLLEALLGVFFLFLNQTCGRCTRADVTLLGVASIPGDAVDKSALPDILEDGTPHNRLGSVGSGIAYTGTGDRYLLLADRGPKDGAVKYHCRFHLVEISVHLGDPVAVKPVVISTTLLTNDARGSLCGWSGALKHRFDPEAIRTRRNGNLLIADEYGPSLCEFAPDGSQVRAWDIPAKFRTKHSDADSDKELRANTTGRAPNRGFEGLAVTPDGGQLYAALQSPLLQDGGRDGVNIRLLKIDLETRTTKEFVYVLDDNQNGLGEIVAINDHQFLVVERDGHGGKKAKYKKIIFVELNGAGDVSDLPSLPKDGLPPDVASVQKRVFFDLLDPTLGLVGPRFPAKIEGLAFGPDLPDGRRLLLITSDNDFNASEPTWIYAFAINAEALPKYRPEIPRP